MIEELRRLDFTTVGISSNFQTRYVGWRYCQTPILIIFEWHMLLVLLFICFGRKEEMKFYRWRFIIYITCCSFLDLSIRSVITVN